MMTRNGTIDTRVYNTNITTTPRPPSAVPTSNTHFFGNTFPRKINSVKFTNHLLLGLPKTVFVTEDGGQTLHLHKRGIISEVQELQ